MLDSRLQNINDEQLKDPEHPVIIIEGRVTLINLCGNLPVIQIVSTNLDRMNFRALLSNNVDAEVACELLGEKVQATFGLRGEEPNKGGLPLRLERLEAEVPDPGKTYKGPEDGMAKGES